MAEPEKKEFGIIPDDFIGNNDVSSLKVRPNRPTEYGGDGLSAKQLQARFDTLVKRVIAEYNTLVDIFNGVDGKDATEYIKLSDTEGDSLRALLDQFIGFDEGKLFIKALRGEFEEVTTPDGDE